MHAGVAEEEPEERPEPSSPATQLEEAAGQPSGAASDGPAEQLEEDAEDPVVVTLAEEDLAEHAPREGFGEKVAVAKPEEDLGPDVSNHDAAEDHVLEEVHDEISQGSEADEDTEEADSIKKKSKRPHSSSKEGEANLAGIRTWAIHSR